MQIPLLYLSLEWHLGPVLGRGSFSTVYQATHRLEGADYALKMAVFYRGQDTLQWVKEVHAWQASRGTVCPHPNLVHYYGAWVEPHPQDNSTKGYIQLELCGITVAE